MPWQAISTTRRTPKIQPSLFEAYVFVETQSLLAGKHNFTKAYRSCKAPRRMMGLLSLDSRHQRA
jgi:hypothetical protein